MDELPLYPTPQQATNYARQQETQPRKPSQPQVRPPPSNRHGSNHSQQSYKQYGQQRPPQGYSTGPSSEYYSSQASLSSHASPPPNHSQYHQHHAPPQGSYHQLQAQAPPPPQQQPQQQPIYHNQPPVTSMHASYQPQAAPHPIPQQQYQVYQNDGHAAPKLRKLSTGTSPPRSMNRSRDSLPEKAPSAKQKLEMELRSVFEKVDVDRSGRISAKELSYALLNFDRTRFQDSTIKLMINLFSSESSSKSLNFEQFVSLWKYLSAYKKLFVQADMDKSGDISFGEFQKVLEQIGYKLDTDLVLHLFLKYSEKDEGRVGRLKFDSFIELLVYLRKLTDIFKKYDKDLSGTAIISFSNFLFEVSSLT